MVPDLVPLVDHAAEQVLISFDLLTDDEKCRLCAALLQSVQKPLRILPVRTVVKGQRHIGCRLLHGWHRLSAQGQQHKQRQQRHSQPVISIPHVLTPLSRQHMREEGYLMRVCSNVSVRPALGKEKALFYGFAKCHRKGLFIHLVLRPARSSRSPQHRRGERRCG